MGVQEGLGEPSAVDRLAVDGFDELSDRAIAEIYDAREVVETEVERLAVPRIGEAALAEMRSAIAVQDQAVRQRDSVAMIAGNRTFHFALFERCPNPWLVRFVSQLWDVIDPYRVVAYRRMFEESDDKLVGGEVLVEHHRILTALSRGGNERALHLLRRHRGRSQAFVETLSGPRASSLSDPPA